MLYATQLARAQAHAEAIHLYMYGECKLAFTTCISFLVQARHRLELQLRPIAIFCRARALNTLLLNISPVSPCNAAPQAAFQRWLPPHAAALNFTYMPTTFARAASAT